MGGNININLEKLDCNYM